MSRRWRSGVGSERNGTRGVACWRLTRGMQRLEERDESRRFRGAQILAVGRHVAATLDHLSNQLILRQAYSHGVQSRTALSALVAERMAVVALLHLENQ